MPCGKEVNEIYNTAGNQRPQKHLPEITGLGCDILVVNAHHQDARYHDRYQLSDTEGNFSDMILDFHIGAGYFDWVTVQPRKAR